MRKFNLWIILCMFSFVYCSNSNNAEAEAEDYSYDPEYGQTAKIDTVYIDSFYIENSAFVENQESVMEFYKNRNYRTAWFYDKEPKPQARKLINRLQNAENDGLIIDNYSQKDIEALDQFVLEKGYSNKKINEEKIREMDLKMTNLYFQYARHLNLGVLQPEKAGLSWHVTDKKTDLVYELDSILKRDGDEDPFKAIEPDHKQYRLLKSYLADYRQIKEDGGWEKLNVDLLEYGDSSEAVVDLRKRLFVTGYIPDTTSYFSRRQVFDSTLVKAVKEFQKRHGLEQDGVVGGNTLEMMNMTVDDKIEKLIINMERFRWLPENMGEPHVLVNIPAFELYVRSNDSVMIQMKVITGETVNQTVLFSDSMEYVVFSPYWNVPYSIATEEILPKAKGNPGYLTANNYQVLSGNDVISPYNVNWHNYSTENFPYRIRQKPGLSNALGTVKFIFPNKYNIYLHDTPAKHLFDKAERDFSHGCIRVEKPNQFAQFVLRNKPEWDSTKIEEYRGMDKPERVYLDKKIPVYVLYFTAWVDQEGILQFREDIYGHDDEMSSKYFADR